MEETQVGVNHGDVVLVTSVNDNLVVSGACWAGHVAHATLPNEKKLQPKAISVKVKWNLFWGREGRCERLKTALLEPPQGKKGAQPVCCDSPHKFL